MEQTPLLTIAIPTYNRAAILDQALTHLIPQVKEHSEKIEIIISDNCSTDDTKTIAEKYKSQGIFINYHKNETNIGADGNCVRCFRLAKGKYLWILGDDDFLLDNTLEGILEVLGQYEIGLLHLRENKNASDTIQISSKIEDFLKTVSFNITFISTNIFRKDIDLGFDLDSYKGSYLSLMPVYYAAALSGHTNILYFPPVLTPGIDSENNGGYNYFLVFVKNYLDICQSYFVDKLGLPELFDYEMYNLFDLHVSYFLNKLLIKKKLGNFSIAQGWRILFVKYGKKLYFYKRIIRLWWAYQKDKISDIKHSIKKTIMKRV